MKKRRSYRPTVEALEALRLLSSATQTLPDLNVAAEVAAGDASPMPGLEASGIAWDEALIQTRFAEILGLDRGSSTIDSGKISVSVADAKDVESGLAQLNRYLSRAWFRSGVPAQMHEDCSQAVYVQLLQTFGRARFDHLLGDIGQNGIRDVLSRETEEGPDFFRAIDTVKKRAQREKTFQPLDTIEVASSPRAQETHSLSRDELQEVIDQSLTPREASLVYDTLIGKTPAEIALQWGVAPKTVSNEKTRVIQKLRDALVAEGID
ncbi:MAG: hypothetical protein NVSMB9_01820 [Isosphaeraceae bacterium]